MTSLTSQIESYLQKTLSTQVSLIEWESATRLPPVLNHRFRFFQAELLNRAVLLIVDDDPDEQPPGTIRKQIEKVRERWGGVVVYVREQISSYNRSRLIQHQVSFLVPGTQLFIPELATDLRESYPKVLKQNFSTFSPSAQAVLIFALLRDSNEPLTSSVVSPALAYSPITLSRAFDAIEAADLCVSEIMGKSRYLHFKLSKHETWSQAQDYLRSPVKSRHYMHADLQRRFGLYAGLSALERFSMIAGPRNPTIAVSREQWKVYRLEKSTYSDELRDPDLTEVEVWSYPPLEFRDSQSVDPLSLYLSFESLNDDRTEYALEEMMRQLPW